MDYGSPSDSLVCTKNSYITSCIARGGGDLPYETDGDARRLA